MNQKRLRVHQVHPLKLATDWGTGIIALVLFWRHAPRAGLVVAVVPSALISALLLRWGDLSSLEQSGFGRAVARAMTPEIQAVRLGGYGVMVVGAWRHRPILLALGLLVILFGWWRGALVACTEPSEIWRSGVERR